MQATTVGYGSFNMVDPANPSLNTYPSAIGFSNTGFYLEECTGIDLETNTFYGLKLALILAGPQPNEDKQITGNSFYRNRKGLVFASNYAQNSNLRYLNFTCNLFEDQVSIQNIAPRYGIYINAGANLETLGNCLFRVGNGFPGPNFSSGRTSPAQAAIDYNAHASHFKSIYNNSTSKALYFTYYNSYVPPVGNSASGIAPEIVNPTYHNYPGSIHILACSTRVRWWETQLSLPPPQTNPDVPCTDLPMVYYLNNKYHPGGREGIAETASDWILYPNPSSGEFQIRGADARLVEKVNLINSLGQAVSCPWQIADGEMKISAQCAPGIYKPVLHLKDGSTQILESICVQ